MWITTVNTQERQNKTAAECENTDKCKPEIRRQHHRRYVRSGGDMS